MVLAPAGGQEEPMEAAPQVGAPQGSQNRAETSRPEPHAVARRDSAKSADVGRPGGADDEEIDEGSVGGMEFREIARIVLNMESREAVLLLSYLNDGQVLGILRSMKVRDAARILSMLPKGRADALGQRLLAPPEESSQ